MQSYCISGCLNLIQFPSIIRGCYRIVVANYYVSMLARDNKSYIEIIFLEFGHPGIE
jgi:hypothetical protein